MSRESSKNKSGPRRRLIERAVYASTACALISTTPLHSSRPALAAQEESTTPSVAPAKASQTPGDSLVSRLSNELNQLKEERESLKTPATESAPEPGDESSDRAATLRRQIQDLVEKLNRRVGPEEQGNIDAPPPPNTPAAKRSPGKASRQRTGAEVKPGHDPAAAGSQGAGQVADPLALARVLIRHGDYAAALAHLQAISLAKLTNDDRLMVQYLTATCLRKQGETKDASLLYREVANCKGDELLADCAHWQLNSIRWREELNAQLEQLRERRQALEGNR